LLELSIPKTFLFQVLGHLYRHLVTCKRQLGTNSNSIVTLSPIVSNSYTGNKQALLPP